MTVLLVALGGGCGAVLRYLIDRKVRRRANSVFPWGTLTVNVIGSAILGVLTGWAVTVGDSGSLRSLVGVGLCGGLTTFSTFGYETVRLLTERARLFAVANVVVTLLAGLGAAAAGLLLAAAVFR